MLQIKQLTKIYKLKKSPSVKALDSVSLTFPDTGMVFLLGKSGSGKSTLLNVLGGLDTFDSGEIVIRGSKTSHFRQSDFDSYRNTYVGFIFQEYNVLEEFSVGANVALALELQGKKATDEAIGAILREVDLEGYGSRKPNELSGGQKQRVAIARALVKDPKIIMADEPTGALDSVTGKQVLDTLKALSRTRLVIVVSHDREFAQLYADRIIELSDGRVIADEEYITNSSTEEEKALLFEEGEVRIAAGYRLTEADRLQINEYLAALEEGKSLSVRPKERTGRISRPTVPVEEKVSGEALHLIRSRLPLKAAFRMGSGALKHKKIRLAFTILLSCIAFGLFGLADTFGAYDHITSCINSILDSGITYASVVRAEKFDSASGGEEFYYSQRGKISEEELDRIREESGVSVKGVFVPMGQELSFQSLYNEKAEFTQSDFHIYPYSFNGFTQVSGKDALAGMGMELLAGRLPDGDKNEIAISEYICETFYIGGFLKEAEADGKKAQYDTIRTPEDMLGRKFPLGGTEYEVVGVVSSGFDLDRYRPLTEKDEDITTAEDLINYALMSELRGIRSYSLCQVALVGEGSLEKILASEPLFSRPENGYLDFAVGNDEMKNYFGSEYYGTLSDSEGYSIAWLDGEKEGLGENEIVVSIEVLLGHFGFVPDFDGETNYYGEDGRFLWSALSPQDQAELLSFCRELGSIEVTSYSYHTGDQRTVKNVCIAGILLEDEDLSKARLNTVILVSDSLLETVLIPNDGTYQYAVGQMPTDRAALERLVRYCYREDHPVRYELQNPVTFELDGIHELLVILADVFLYIGLGFALFASLMLANFIGTSIAYKKQEIGILRAIGARSGDVFRIFFSESFCIAMINFVLSAIGTLGAVLLINHFFRSETGILITLLHFSIRQVILLFGTSILAAFVASFLPVRRIASKKPIDAIRGR